MILASLRTTLSNWAKMKQEMIPETFDQNSFLASLRTDCPLKSCLLKLLLILYNHPSFSLLPASFISLHPLVTSAVVVPGSSG